MMRRRALARRFGLGCGDIDWTGLERPQWLRLAARICAFRDSDRKTLDDGEATCTVRRCGRGPRGGPKNEPCIIDPTVSPSRSAALTFALLVVVVGRRALVTGGFLPMIR